MGAWVERTGVRAHSPLLVHGGPDRCSGNRIGETQIDPVENLRLALARARSFPSESRRCGRGRGMVSGVGLAKAARRLSAVQAGVQSGSSPSNRMGARYG